MKKTNSELIAELNEIRKNQKTISDFDSVQEWVSYCQGIAKQKAEILQQLEALNK